MSNKIAIQGGPASYHEAAAARLQPDAEIIYLETFSDVFAAVKAGEVDGAIVAIANNRVQYISDTYEYLTSTKCLAQITGETYLHIEHALLAPQGAQLKAIREVHSQAPALGQCSHFLEHVLPHAVVVEQSDTALSAKIVAETNDPTIAAIASEAAGKLYGLETLKLNVQDDPSNITRFVSIALAQDTHVGPDSNKTSMLLTTPQTVGALADALILFKDAGISLSSLQSNLIPNSAFNMQFFLEFDAGLLEERTQKLLTKLTSSGYITKVLGSYKSAEVPIVDSGNGSAVTPARADSSQAANRL